MDERLEPERWPLDRLIDYILSTHHAYVRAALPAIGRELAALRGAHGAAHPELVRVVAVFAWVTSDLEQHMMKEEQVLFPYVRDLAAGADQPGGAGVSPFGTVANPIRMMEREHEEVAGALRVIRDLTGDYAVPDDGDATYTRCLFDLARFERDLHRHVHLENNVLFPKALELEGRALG